MFPMALTLCLVSMPDYPVCVWLCIYMYVGKISRKGIKKSVNSYL